MNHLVFYALPENAEFFVDLVNTLESHEGTTCDVIFSHYDYLRLERIIGTDSAKKMISSEKCTFMLR